MVKNAPKQAPEGLKEFLLKNFLTTQQELDQFQQNDEKEYDDDEWITVLTLYSKNLGNDF